MYVWGISGKKLCRLILVINPSNKWYNRNIKRFKNAHARNFRNSKWALGNLGTNVQFWFFNYSACLQWPKSVNPRTVFTVIFIRTYVVLLYPFGDLLPVLLYSLWQQDCDALHEEYLLLIIARSNWKSPHFELGFGAITVYRDIITRSDVIFRGLQNLRGIEGS